MGFEFQLTLNAAIDQCDISMKFKKKVEMFFVHHKLNILLKRFQLRGSYSANDEFLPAATPQFLRKLAKIVLAPQQSRKA